MTKKSDQKVSQRVTVPVHSEEDEEDSKVDLQKKVDDLGDRMDLVTKSIPDDIARTNVANPEDRQLSERVFEKTGHLEPPYPPEMLVKLFEHSNSIRPNIDAYAVNIDGNGHHLAPVIDLDSDEAFDKVRDSMFVDSLMEAESAGEDPPDFPSDEEVRTRIEEMQSEMRIEKARLDSFFRFSSVDESFISLRKKTRTDLEIMGNGFWEVVRSFDGRPVQFNYIPAFTVRLLPSDKQSVETTQRVKRTPISYADVPIVRRFRRFVQVFEGKKVFYKEFGDPRTISASSGQPYKDIKELQSKEEGAVPATEILHFKIHSPRSVYGVPRWIGTLLSVLGSRQSEEVNFLYFENKSVPPMAVLVSGGRLTQDSTKRIQDYLENKIRGRGNFHKVLILEATPSSEGAIDSSESAMKIQIQPLTSAQQKDALFQKYDERNIDKVGMAFRMPRLVRGDIRDFNRASAEASLEFAETQVFSPEREDFDWNINRKILADLGVRFWNFVSNAPTTKNPLDLTEIVTGLVKHSILTPAEGRELAEGILNREFKKIEDLWTLIPPELLKKGILPDEASIPEPEGDPNSGHGEDDPEPKKKSTIGKRYKSASERRELQQLASKLLKFREIMKQEEQATATQRFENGIQEDHEPEVVRMSVEEFRQLGIVPNDESAND